MKNHKLIILGLFVLALIGAIVESVQINSVEAATATLGPKVTWCSTGLYAPTKGVAAEICQNQTASLGRYEYEVPECAAEYKDFVVRLPMNKNGLWSKPGENEVCWPSGNFGVSTTTGKEVVRLHRSSSSDPRDIVVRWYSDKPLSVAAVVAKRFKSIFSQ